MVVWQKEKILTQPTLDHARGRKVQNPSQPLQTFGPPFACVQTFPLAAAISARRSLTIWSLGHVVLPVRTSADFLSRSPHDRVFWIEIRPIWAAFICSKSIAHRILRRSPRRQMARIIIHVDPSSG